MRHNSALGGVLRLSLAVGLVATLGGCGFRDAVGLSKRPPDEFSVVTKAPLIVPPDYGLRPPRAGAKGAGASDAGGSAARSVFGKRTRSAATDASPGEIALLRQTGALNVDAGIRDQIRRDNGVGGEWDDVYEDEDGKGFLDKLKFWKDDDDNDAQPE